MRQCSLLNYEGEVLEGIFLVGIVQLSARIITTLCMDRCRSIKLVGKKTACTCLLPEQTGTNQ